MGFDFERLGRRIAEERKHFRKVSQEKMAEDLGMYQADISNIERARKGREKDLISKAGLWKKRNRRADEAGRTRRDSRLSDNSLAIVSLGAECF